MLPHRKLPNEVDTPWRAWNRFWFEGDHRLELAGLRMIVGVVMLGWLLTLFGKQTEYFGFNGWMDADAYSAARKVSLSISPDSRLPVAAWSPTYLVSSPVALHAAYFGAIAVAVLFTLGVALSITSPLAWLTTAAFTSNPILHGNGGESLLLVFTFYLMLGTLLENAVPAAAATFAIRLTQVHTALLIFSAGVFKLQSSTWWEGIALWFPMHRPYELTLEAIETMRTQPAGVQWELFWLSVASYLTIAWQLTFPFLAFQRAAKWWIVGGAIFGVVGSCFIYRMPMFGFLHLAAALAFLPDRDWRILSAWAARRYSEPANPQTQPPSLARESPAHS